MTGSIVVHAIASMFPEMGDDEYEALKADIKENGLREPLWLHEGRIIDGRHRFRACQELGLKPATRNWDGKGSLASFVLSLNLHRRNLTSGQRSAVGVEFKEWFAKEAKDRQKAAGGDKVSEKARALPQIIAEAVNGKKNSGEARQQAAQVSGTNRQYVNDSAKLKKNAPDLFKKVHEGKATVPQARNELRKREKLAALEQKAAEVEFTKDAPLWTLFHGDVIDGLTSVIAHQPRARLIFADPPYNIGIDYGSGAKADQLPAAKYMLWAADWLDLCKECLTPDGSLWVMIGDEYAAEYAVAIKAAGLTIRSWIKWYETFGVNCSRNFNRTSRHIFYAVVDAKKHVFNESAVSRPSDRQTKYNDKRAAEGGKILDDVWTHVPRLTGTCEERIPSFPTQLPVALVKTIVECASDPGDLVVDPFSGSGTTGVACIQTRRKFFGIEKSETFIDLADKRLKVTA